MTTQFTSYRVSWSAWRDPLAALGLCLALLLVVYRETVESIGTSWAQDPFGHGYVVVPVAVYLAWLRRPLLAPIVPVPSYVALVALAALSFVWLLGNLTATTIVQQVALIGMIGGLVWAVLGSAATRVLLFPLAFLLFALPLADRLVPTLQDFTARFAVRLVTLVGVPALLENHVISIPGSQWLVAEACSGVNYLVASLALGYVYSGTTYRYWRHRLGFFAASAVVPLIANGFRVFTTILIASFGATQVAAGLGHELYGLVIFAVIAFVLVATCGRWREAPSDESHGAFHGTSEARPTYVGSRWQVLFAAIPCALILAAGPASAAWLRLESVPAEYAGPTTISVSGSWRPVNERPFSWTPRFREPGRETVRVYRSGRDVVKLYVAHYPATQPNVKLATEGNSLFDAPWWAAAVRDVMVPVFGRPLELRETVVRSAYTSLRIWHWYVVDGTATGNDYMTKLLFARARLVRSPKESLAIAIATEEHDESAASTRLRKFVEDLSIRPPLSDAARDVARR